jgi:hypothetical protein
MFPGHIVVEDEEDEQQHFDFGEIVFEGDGFDAVSVKSLVEALNSARGKDVAKKTEKIMAENNLDMLQQGIITRFHPLYIAASAHVYKTLQNWTYLSDSDGGSSAAFRQWIDAPFEDQVKTIMDIISTSLFSQLDPIVCQCAALLHKSIQPTTSTADEATISMFAKLQKRCI